MIKPKWLTKKDLDESKIDPKLPPMYNVVLQYGYDIQNPEVKKDFQNDKKPWYSILGWDEECCKIFWDMLYKSYMKNWNSTRKWTTESKFEFKRFQKNMPVDYILDGPTSSKENWKNGV